MFGTLRVELDIDKLVEVGFLTSAGDGEINWPKEKKEGFNFTLETKLPPRKGAYAHEDYDNFDPAIETFLKEDFSGFATRYSWYGPMPSCPERALGIYSREGATAYLDASGKNRDLLKLIIYADTYEALRGIYFALRRGEIKPGAGVNWSVAQVQ